jgi:tetratricopeptide (TPR) repeat protein
MRYINLAAVIGLCVGLLAACAGTGESKKESETSQAQMQQQPPETQVSPQARQSYDDALKAMSIGDNEKARKLLTSLTQSYPNLSGPYTNLGLLYFREGKIDEAQTAFEQAIKVNPKSAVSYNHLGIINRGKGKFQEAKEDYERALNINGDYAYAHLNIGILYDLYLGDLDKALEHYQRFQALSPEKDKEVEKWIVDLQRRIKTAQ